MKKIFYLFVALLISQNLLAVDKTWTGATSTNWGTASNWSPSGVPSSSDFVYVPNVTNKPVIASGTTANALQIRIETSSSLTINSGGILSMLNVPYNSSNPRVIELAGSSTLTNNGTITISSVVDANGDNNFLIILRDNTTFNNNGTVNLSDGYQSIYMNGLNAILNNNSSGTITMNNGFGFAGNPTGSGSAINNQGTITYSGLNYFIYIYPNGNPFTITNSGIMNVNGNGSVGVYLNSNGNLTNQACGRIFMTSTSARYISAGGSTSNIGLISVASTLDNTSGTFNNNSGGVLKYNSLTGTITNNNGSVIVNDNPTNSTIFTYQGTFTGTVNGIFTNAAATTSAGTFTAPNTFTPSVTLPTGSQTLYAKITPSGGACNYVVPFTYQNGCSQVATATETMTWNGSASTDWSNPCNWTPNGVPTATNPVNITLAGANVIITSSATASAKSINMSGTFTNGVNLTVNENATLRIGSTETTVTKLDLVQYATLINGGRIFFETPTGGSVNSKLTMGMDATTLENGGRININSTANTPLEIGGNGVNGPRAKIFNYNCGRIITTGNYLQNAGGEFDNFGYFQIAGNMGVIASYVNKSGGVLFYGGSLNLNSINHEQNSVRVNNNPTNSTIFSYTGTFLGTVNGIFTDATATTSAGSFTAPNTFTPSGTLPSGSQTLYAKITPSTALCNYVVPFTYNNAGSPEINVKGNSISINDGETNYTNNDHRDFGIANVALGSIVRTFTIENTGNNALTIPADGITKSGTHQADFTIGGITLPATIAANSSTTFTITFDPSAAGTRTATISIANDDADENPYNFSIQGTGSSPTVTCTDIPLATEYNTNNGARGIMFDLITGTTPITLTSFDANLYLGTANYEIYYKVGSYQGSENNSAAWTRIGDPFSVTSPGINNPTPLPLSINISIPANSTYGFYLTGAGVSSGGVNYNSSNSPETVAAVVVNDGNLSIFGGLGKAYPFATTYGIRFPSLTAHYSLGINCQEINLKGNNVSIVSGDITPSNSDDTDFGSANVASGTVVRTFTIENTGNGPLTIPANGITKSGTHQADFTIGGITLPATIATNSSSTFTVTFDPSAVGTRSANISIANDDADENPYTFAIQGTGAGTNISINDVLLNEGNSGTTSFDFTVSLSAPAGAGGVTFDINTIAGSASSNDYTNKSLTSQTIPAGSSNYIFSVLINGDIDFESAETFSVQLSNVTGATIGRGIGTGTILNDDCSQVATATETMTWNGSVSTDWSNPCNWTPNGIPTATNPTIIPATTNDPIILSGSVVAKRTQITGSGAILTVNSGATLTVSSTDGALNLSNSGQLINRGIINASNNNSNFISAYALSLGNNTSFDNYGSLNLTSPQNTGLEVGNGSTVHNFTGGLISITARSGIRGEGPFINDAGASISIVGTSSAFQYNGSVNNSGLIDITGQMEANSGAQINNNSCGTIKLTADYFNGLSATTTNNGFLLIGGTLHSPVGGTFTNNAVLKYGGLNISSILNNSGNASVIVNDSPTPIFTYGGIYNGAGANIINGIFTNQTATTSAGAFTAPNTFVPNISLPTGSQTLYAKITPSSGACSYVVPFIYVNCTGFTAQITGTTNLNCAVTSVTRTASGGNSYNWSGPNSFSASTAVATITAVGTYTVTVTGSNGCTATTTTSVTSDITIPNVQITGSNNLSCAITNVTRTASGGGTYLWSNGLGTNAQATISSAGIYTVTVTGSNGCTATATTSVTSDITIPNVQITGSNNLSCAVTNVTRIASGGGSYLWSNGLGTNAQATITSAGIYTVTVTGTNGCTATATTSVTSDITIPNVQITGSNNLSCAVITITRTASGGGSYLWSNGLGTNAQATITSAGIYTVTVTGTNGCTATATTSVTNDGSLPNIQITGSDNLSCAVTNVTRTASGGGSYLWSNGLGTNAQATITSAGIYTVTVTGSNGCTATATTSATSDITIPNVQITGSNNLSCAVTNVTRTASGSGSYSWSNGLGTNAQATISSAGIYTVTVTGTNGCTATATTSVTNDGSLPNVQIAGSDNLSCAITNVTRTASGGGTYLWSNGLGTNAQATISSAGIYTVTVTGTNGCTATATTSVTSDITIPNVQITGSDNLSCAITNVTRTASGGGSYLWSNGLGTNAQATISSAGIYTVTVTGTNGCTATATTSVTSDITIPNVQITGSNNLSCAITNVTRTASGGGSYSWSNGLGTNAQATITSAGIYTVTVTGTNGCTATATTSITNDGSLPNVQIAGSDNLSCAITNVTRTASGGGSYFWSNGLGTNAQATISSAGIYTVTVTGSNGCTATTTTSVTNDGSLPNIQITGSNNLSCAITNVTRTASGGGSYLWSNGLGTNAQATITSAGIYTVTVTGSNGCTATATTSVTSDITIPNVQITGSNNLSCAITNVTRTASGGGSYLWSNGLGTNAQATISSAGIYTVTVTGTNGCTATATTFVTNDGSLPNIQITGSDNLSCAITNVTRTASGGGTYLWSNGLGTNAQATISSAGIYTVTVTGTNGCTATATTSVTNDENSPNIQITGSDNLSCAVTSVTRTASGGGTYIWSNGLGTNAQATITSSGTYTVTVTGTNGCTATATTSVAFTNDLVVTASNSGPYRVGNTIELNASTGSNYTWSGPNNFVSTSQNPSISNALVANAGIYTVTVSTGVCSATATTNVVVDALLDPCIPIIDYQFVKAGNPYQPLFNLTNGMIINQIADPVSIIAVPICPTVTIESLVMKLQGPNINEEILQNISPYAIFDNTGNNTNGRIFAPGVYTLTVTGYNQDNMLGSINYGPVVTTFTILPNTVSIAAPTVSKTVICGGGNLDVNFAVSGIFSPTNQFKVELSDANGNFGSVALLGNIGGSATFTYPTIIGTSNSVGVITCSIPSTLVGGTNYRVRVVSTNGVSVSQVSSNPITIHPRDLNLVSPNDDYSTNIGTKQATNKVTASNKISATANVNYQAGKAIVLNAGFEANAGTIFKAEIRGCEN